MSLLRLQWSSAAHMCVLGTSCMVGNAFMVRGQIRVPTVNQLKLNPTVVKATRIEGMHRYKDRTVASKLAGDTSQPTPEKGYYSGRKSCLGWIVKFFSTSWDFHGK